ncbi:MAG: hypothetical protein ACI87X_001382 [Candidatus Arcticimaribacter sp.]|jgi:hypothetical protein
MNYVVIGTLAIFFIASVFYQIKSLQKWMKVFNPFNLLPNYSFFAPKPYVNDYRLAYKIVSDETSEWVEIPIYKKFKLIRVIWNPFKYYNKGMIDTTNFLLKEFHSLENKNFIKISVNYLSILMVISAYLKQEGLSEKTIQFAILSSEGGETVKVKNVVFASSHQTLNI